MTLYESIVKWNNIHGKGSVDRQRRITQAEWQEWHRSNHKDLWELADVYFTSAYLHYLIQEGNHEHHSSFVEAERLVTEYNAYNHVEAVIKSNWTKYIKASDMSKQEANQEAVRIEKESNGRYVNVTPHKSGGYWYFLGNEPKTGTVGKVLKPYTFVSADKLIP